MVDFDNVSNSLSASDTVADCLDDGLNLGNSETWATGTMITTMATDIMRKEEIRLQTFHHWPTGWGATLARYGFCSVSDDASGSVRCVFCGLLISNFSSPEEANLGHWQSARLTCPYLRGENVHNVPLEENSRTHQKSPSPHSGLLQHTHALRQGADQGSSSSSSRQWGETTPGRFSVIECTPEAMSGSPGSASQPAGGSGLSHSRPKPDAVPWQEIVRTARYPAMASCQARLKTLARWPLLKPSPAELAKAGFFHVRCTSSPPNSAAPLGSGGRSQTPPQQCGGDSVRCFWCGETIHHWEETDDALLEHARLSPSCVYVVQVLGQQLHEDIVNNVIATRTTISSSSSSRHRQLVSAAPVRSHTNTNSPSSTNRPLSNARPARPKLTSAQLDELMLSPPVQTVLQMGFPPHLIRDVLSHNSERLSADTLCSLALQAAEHTPKPHSPSPGAERSPVSCGRLGDEDLFRFVLEQRQNPGQTNLNSFLQSCGSADPSRRQEGTVERVEAGREGSDTKLMCKVCSEAEARAMFRPCNHLVCCHRCIALFTSCPVCFQIIEDVLTVNLT